MTAERWNLRRKNGYTLPLAMVILLIAGNIGLAIFTMIKSERIESFHRYVKSQAELDIESALDYSLVKIQSGKEPWRTDSLAYQSTDGNIRFSLSHKQKGAYALLDIFSKDSLERLAKWWKSEDATQPESADPTPTSETSEKKNDSNKKDPPNPPKKKRQFEKVKLVRFKLKPDRNKMGQRLCLSEHPFGTLKRALGASYFLLKGKRKNNGEFALMSMGYNLVRGLNIYGFWGLMQRVKG